MKPLKLLLTSLILLLLSIVTILEGQAQITPGDSGNFITTWKTTSTNESITIPTPSGITYNYSIAWGDGNIDTGVTGDATHTYASPGVHTVEITGTFPRILFFNSSSSNAQKILSVEQWGSNAWTGMNGAFTNCSNLQVNATDTPNLSGVTRMNSMFLGATSLNSSNLSNWDVSNVTNMSGMFAEATSFNQNISGWNVSNVTNMNSMFSGATSFNQDITGWNVSNVTSMASMFRNASSFNQNIGGWNVSNVTILGSMFYGASSFNQNIGNWNVSNVTNMSWMFREATVFNGNIGGWNVSNVTDMERMFREADSFNQDIGSWDVSGVTTMREMFQGAISFNQDLGWTVSNVTNMRGMFAGASAFNGNIGNWNVSSVNTMQNMFLGASSFNQNIGNWNVGGVTNMGSMFRLASAFNQNIGGWNVSGVTQMWGMFDKAISFDQDLSNWNVSNVTFMREMFQEASAFNQDIGGWNVSNVTNMASMFNRARAFNQNIGGWNISNVTNMGLMFNDTNLSVANYDATLIDWSSQSVKSGTYLGATGLKYCSGKAARQSLISNYNWTINGDELYPGCELLTGGPGFRMLSSPSQVTLAELLEPLWTQGASGADYPSGPPNVWRWDISTADWLAVTDLSAAFTEGTGILVYVFDEDELGNPSSAGFPKTLIVDGPANTFPLTLTPPEVNPNSGGFSLLGNPVEDGISWDNGTFYSGFDDVVYVWDPNKGTDGDWVIWSGGAGDLTGGVIHPFQGFFVRRSTGSSGPFLQMFTTTSSQDFYGKKASEEPVMVRLHMKGEEGLESTAWLRFSDQGSLESNRGDALKLQSFSSDYAVLGMSSRSEESPLLALKHLPINLNSPLEIPLVATATRGEIFTLEATRMSIPEEWSLTLRDTYTGAQIAVEPGMNYNFKLTDNEHFQKIPGHNGNTQGIVPPNIHALSNPAKQAEDSPVARFMLTITQEEYDGAELPETFVLKQNYPNPFNPSTVISYQLPTDSRVRLEVFDMIGRQVATLVNETVEAGQHQVDFNAEHLTSGVYLYRLQTDSKIFTKKLTLLK